MARFEGIVHGVVVQITTSTERPPALAANQAGGSTSSKRT